MKSGRQGYIAGELPARLFFRPLVRTLVPKGWMLEDASRSAFDDDVARTDGPETSMSSPSLQEDLKLSSTAMRRNRCKPVDSGLPLAGGQARMAEYRDRNEAEMEGATERHSDSEDRFASGRCLRQIPDSYTQPSNCRDADLHNHFNHPIKLQSKGVVVTPPAPSE